VAELLHVVQPPGARDVEAAFDERSCDVVSGRLLALDDQRWIGDCRTSGSGYAIPVSRARCARSTFHLVQGIRTEGRNDVFVEVFVLVVPKDEDKVGIEGVERVPRAAKSRNQVRTVLARRAQALVIAPFFAHLRRPVRRVLPFRRRELAGEVPSEVDVRHTLVGECKMGRVSTADPDNLAHGPPNRLECARTTTARAVR